jgi:hypothetical protein
VSKGNGKPKPAEEPADGETPALVPQPHGGALYSGGVPGNRGGQLGGRPRSEVRAALRAAFDARLPRLQAIADDADVGDALKALDLMGKYGLGTVKEISLDDVRSRLTRQLEVIRSLLPPEQAEAVILAIREVWT